MRPVERVNQEVAAMKFVKEKTRTPIPEVIAFDIAKGRFEGLAPFIIMEFIEWERLDEVLYQGDKLKPGVEQSNLKFIYKQVAQIYLKLDSHNFDQNRWIVNITGPSVLARRACSNDIEN
jgi:hypothetical protein